MIQIQQTETYATWFAGLRVRIDHGPGFRVYFVQLGDVLIVLLVGGDKSTLDKDIPNAKALARDLKEF
ncbi:MAG: hypothetical protein EBS73_15600 [Betaproteobacteria bacterium]|nr:hypothetical protein [Betaproteobacteria bacterium]